MEKLERRGKSRENYLVWEDVGCTDGEEMLRVLVRDDVGAAMIHPNVTSSIDGVLERIQPRKRATHLIYL